MNIPLVQHFMDEYELVEACKKMLPAAQNAVYKKYAKPLLILCLRYVGREEDAKELLTDTFVQAFKKIEGFEYLGEGSLQAWLKKIAVNQCLMHLRKNKLRFEELKETHEDFTHENEQAIDQLSAKEIMMLIHNLPTGYRAVFNLYVFEEMSHKEIALLLNISEGTSKSQLHKARQLLQRELIHQQKTTL